jgi:hypothetical protein
MNAPWLSLVIALGTASEPRSRTNQQDEEERSALGRMDGAIGSSELQGSGLLRRPRMAPAS